MKQLIVVLFQLCIGLSAYCQSGNLKISYKRNADQSVDFIYEKSEPGSFTVSLEFNELKNAARPYVPTVIKSNYGKLLTLKPINQNQGIGFSYKYSYIRGAMNPKVDSSFVYLLPFKKGTTLNVKEMRFLGESFFGQEKPKNWAAYQFNAPSADTICAVRKGLVVKVEDQYEVDSISHYTSKKNLVVVEHADGTMASYEGFAQAGLLVEPGQTVYPQTPLGVLRKSASAYKNKLAFKLYFLVYPNFKGRGKENLGNQKSRYQFIKPYFFTNEGKIKLRQNFPYDVEYKESHLTMEMSKREKKRMGEK